MARPTKYNHNYPGKKIAKGNMMTMDAIKITQQYMDRLSKLSYEIKDGAYNIYDDREFLRKKTHAYELLTKCLGDLGNDVVQITVIRLRVNLYLSFEDTPECFLYLMCQYIEELLFKADCYAGWGNYTWLNSGFEQWQKDYPNMYDDNTIYQEAQKASRSMPYHGSEYSRQYT